MTLALVDIALSQKNARLPATPSATVLEGVILTALIGRLGVRARSPKVCIYCIGKRKYWALKGYGCFKEWGA